MQDHISSLAIAQMRIEELHEEAERERIAQTAQTPKLGWFSRLTRKPRAIKCETMAHDWIEAGHNTSLHSI